MIQVISEKALYNKDFTSNLRNIDHEINLEFFKFVLSLSEKAKPAFLLSLVCVNPRSTETKFSTHSYYLRNDHNLTLVCLGFWPAMKLLMGEGGGAVSLHP